ncbi:hypothetical protein LINPERHAP1_LOCUS2081 [Linum perenne]
MVIIIIITINDVVMEMAVELGSNKTVEGNPVIYYHAIASSSTPASPHLQMIAAVDVVVVDQPPASAGGTSTSTSTSSGSIPSSHVHEYLIQYTIRTPAISGRGGRVHEDVGLGIHVVKDG